MKSTSKCECGAKLGYIVTPFPPPAQRVCPKCGRLHYEDAVPVDWERVNEGKDKCRLD